MELLYSSHKSWPRREPKAALPSEITVLDSSFNPPHKTHQLLAQLQSAGAAKNGSKNAILLVHSSVNADKVVRPTDPTVEQKLEMIEALAKRLAEEGSVVAVAKLNKPTFVEKSRLLHESLDATLGSRVSFCFPQGWDTLIRFFNKKYYTEPVQDVFSKFFNDEASRVACARRGDISKQEEARFFESDNVKDWTDKVTMYDIPEKFRGISSSAIRSAVKNGEHDIWKNSVLPEVAQVIEKHKLYRS